MNHDYLSRQPYLELLKSIISNQKDNTSGYSFAIDGEWGSGKTWILQELEKQLLEEKENKYLIFHYNAWENDFYDEPLIAIISVMIEYLKKQKTKVKEKDSAKKVVTTSITALTKVAGTIIENKWKINPNDIFEAVKDSGKAIGDMKLTKSDFNNLLPLENALKQIKDVITAMEEPLGYTVGNNLEVIEAVKALKGDNDLQTINPTLSKEWNYEKNNGLKPVDVKPNSDKKVWWKCSKGHEWQARIQHRNNGSGCPECYKEKNKR